MNSLHVTSNREKIAMRISWYSIAVNVFLSLGKFVAGIFGHSAAMVSDAIHSASDVFATFIVMAGIKISGKASDEDHQYGHERLECVASILLSVILALTGLAIGYAGIEKIMHQDTESIAIGHRLCRHRKNHAPGYRVHCNPHVPAPGCRHHFYCS